MLQATCVEKYRDKRGVITGYKIVDGTNKSMCVTPQQLKQAIKNKQINITNLKLTSDNRLLDVKNNAKQNNTKQNSSKQSKQISVADLAKSMQFLYSSLLGMGDNISDEVSNLCSFADIEYDHFDNLENEPEYSEKKMVEALIALFNSGDWSTLEGYIDYFSEYIDELCNNVIYQDAWDIRKNSTVRALAIICKFSKDSLDKGMIHKEAYETIYNILSEVSKVPLVACKLGHSIGHTFFKYLDNSVFSTNSNSAFTVGHVLRPHESEYKVGAYAIHAEIHYEIANKLLGKTTETTELGYSVMFKGSNDSTQVQAEIYKYKRYPRNWDKQTELQTTKKVLEISREDNIENISKKIASELNSIAKQEMGKVL